MMVKQLNIKLYFVKMPGQGQLATDANNKSLPQEDEPIDDMDVSSGTEKADALGKESVMLDIFKGSLPGVC